MNEELKNQIETLFALAVAEPGTKVNIRIYESENYNIRSIDIEVLKIVDGIYSFGYLIDSDKKSEGMACGINAFKGEIKRLFLGYLKAIIRTRSIKSYTTITKYILEVVRYVQGLQDPIQIDKNKIDIEKWEVPLETRKCFLKWIGKVSTPIHAKGRRY